MKWIRIQAFLLVVLLALSHCVWAFADKDLLPLDSQTNMQTGSEEPDSSTEPTATPIVEYSIQAPIQAPTAEPAPTQTSRSAPAPTAAPTAAPTPAPTAAPTPTPTATPTVMPTSESWLSELTSVASPEPAKPKLTILLFDCGVTLYGKKTFPNSIVTEGIDPDGVLLFLVEKLTTSSLIESDAYLICGYHSDLYIPSNGQPTNASDKTALTSQFEKLRDLLEKDRQSSNLARALSDLKTRSIDNFNWDTTYDIQLVIFSGGAINIKNNTNANVQEVKNAVDDLRRIGVKVHAFGLDLAKTQHLDVNVVGQTNWLLDQELFSDEYEQIMTGTLRDYGLAVTNWFATENGYNPGVESNATIPTDAVKGNRYLLWHESSEKFEFLDAAALSAKESNDATFTWIYEKDSQEDQTQRDIEAIGRLLDKDGDSKFDASPLILDGQSDGRWPCDLPSNVDINQYDIISTDENILSVSIENSQLILQGTADGTAMVRISAKSVEAGSATPLEIEVAVNDYRLTELDGMPQSEIEIEKDNPPTNIEVVSAKRGLNAWIERKTIQGEWEKLPDPKNEFVTWRIEGDKMSIDILDEGEYKITAQTLNGDIVMSEKTWEFTASIKFVLDALNPVSLKTPYLREQPEQTFEVTSQGNRIGLTDYTLAVDPANLANIYLRPDGMAAYIVPLEAGKGRIVLKGADGNELGSADLTISGLTANPLFWVLALAAPLCLIGLTAMVVILLARRKR